MSDMNQFADQLQINKKKYEISLKKEEQESNQENVNTLQTENRQTTLQELNNNALNTEKLPKDVILSPEELKKKLNQSDGTMENGQQKEENVNMMEEALAESNVSKTINNLSSQAGNKMMQAKKRRNLEPVDDGSLIEKANEIEAQKKAEASERFENQPEALRENYTALLTIMKEVKASCQRESGSGNSEFMNNVITQVTDFEAYINSKEFNLSKPGDYMRRFNDMRNTISVYYEKNKGTKWTEKGRRRRNLTKNILDRLNSWVDNLPKETMEAGMAKEMAYVDNLKNLLATAGDKKYGTSDNADTWFYIQRAGEKFFDNLDEKTDEEAGKDLAGLLKAAQGYLGTHTGTRFSQQGQDRVGFAKNIVSSVSDILKNCTFGLRIATFDKILEERGSSHRPGDQEANELVKDFLTQYAVDELHAKLGTETGAEKCITEKTAIYMHYRDKFSGAQKSVRQLTKERSENTIYQKGNCVNNMGKSFFINRHGKVDPKYANDAKLAELSVNKALKADPSEATYISRSAFIKQLEQIKITSEMHDKYYLEEHYWEIKKMLFSIHNIDKVFKNWTGECQKACNKEYESYPPSIQKKLDILLRWAKAVENYYETNEKLNGFPINIGNVVNALEVEDMKHAGILEKMNKITNQEEKREYMKEMTKKYPMWDLYQEVEVSPGNIEIREKTEAYIITANRLFEENDLKFTEEEIKTIRYFAYEEEAKKESKGNHEKSKIRPETMAIGNMYKSVHNFTEQEEAKEENKALKEILKDKEFERIYLRRIRFVNYDKDGKPATEEDRKNLEWNRAYGKSITDNNQEDRIRLIKENSEYIADLINQLDFDRIFDFDYWNNNIDLYMVLSNFRFSEPSLRLEKHCLKEDYEILYDYYYGLDSPLKNLLFDCADAFDFLSRRYLGLYSNTFVAGIDESTGEFMPLINREDGLNMNKKALEEELQETKNYFKKLRKSNLEYIASKSQ